MNCPACGKDNPDGNWVCGSCGEQLPPPAQPSQFYDSGYSESEPPQSAPSPSGSGSSSALVKIIALALIAALAGILIWNFLLKSPDIRTPGGTMEAYFNAVADGDCEMVYELTTDEAVSGSYQGSVDECNMFIDLVNIDFTNYRTIEEVIDGDTATVTFEVTLEAMGQSAPAEMTVELLQEDGRWKVGPQ